MDAARGGLTKLLSNAIRGRQAGFSRDKEPEASSVNSVCVNVRVHTCGELRACLGSGVCAFSVRRGTAIFRDSCVVSDSVIPRYLCYLGISDRIISLVLS